jgi:hypothetical protein
MVRPYSVLLYIDSDACTVGLQKNTSSDAGGSTGMTDGTIKTQTERAVLASKASRDALKALYYVIVGLGITESLGRVFLDSSDSFAGIGVFNWPLPLPFILLLAYLPTVCRFVHGASLHIDISQRGGKKALIDFLGFFLQGILFYLMALSMDKAESFLQLFLIMLALDALWLIALAIFGCERPNGTWWQWLASDAVLFLALSMACKNCPGGPETSCYCWIIAGISGIAFVVDYWMNRDFYFPDSGKQIKDA